MRHDFGALSIFQISDVFGTLNLLTLYAEF